jgi:hypothetical protein
MMRARALRIALVAAVAVSALGCQSPDVGQPCTLRWGTDPSVAKPTAADLAANGGSDFFESGNLACEGLVCIVSPAASGTKYGSTTPGEGYCSKPCLTDQDCYDSKTELVCRQMVLDKVFLEQLDAQTRQRYLSDVQFSSYCAVAR